MAGLSAGIVVKSKRRHEIGGRAWNKARRAAFQRCHLAWCSRKRPMVEVMAEGSRKLRGKLVREVEEENVEISCGPLSP